MALRSLALLIAFGAIAPAWAQSETLGTGTENVEEDSESAQSEGNTEDEDAARLDRVTVRSRAASLYRVGESSLGTRTDTPLELVPQSIQVIPRELIEDQAAREITDLYRSISGVSGFSYSGVTFRGFRQDEILYDGVRGDPFNGFAIPQLFNIDSVQVLKGPAGALYGSGAPGGIINYVTKKPTAYEMRKVAIGTGNFDYNSLSAEFSGPLGDGWRYRAGAYFDEENPFRFNTHTENRILDLSIAKDFGNDTTLLLQYTEIGQHLGGARLRGVPANDDGEFLTTIRWNHNEPTDYQDLSARVAQARLDHRFSANFRSDVTVRWYKNTELQNYHEPRGLMDTDGDGAFDYTMREFRDQRRHHDALNVAVNNVYNFDTGALEHTLLFGGDAFTQEGIQYSRRARQVEAGGVVPGLDLVNPVYGLTAGAVYDLAQTTPYDYGESRTVRNGIYLQDQVRINARWNVLAGARWDRFEDEDVVSGESFSDSGTSWRIGSTFEVFDGVRTYATYGTGFEPQGIGDQIAEVGGPFEPETSELMEIGAKTSLLDDRIGLNVAIYQIARENILQPDPRGDVGGDGEDDLVSLGRVESNGFEIDVLADLTELWALNVAYGYNDTRITEATGSMSNAVGDRFANAPRHQLGLWTRYDIPSLQSAVAFGASYVDDRVSIDGQAVQAYTVFDASVQTNLGDWLWQLNVKNLLDEEYAASGFIERSGHFPGEPRRVYLSATYEF
ncbi:MAG TPA: TonB-dependent siderophore receptor [Gammaproteobacteria bacterium]